MRRSVIPKDSPDVVDRLKPMDFMLSSSAIVAGAAEEAVRVVDDA